MRVKNIGFVQPNEPHSDYLNNLGRANQFVKSKEGRLPNGVSVKVCDSEHVKSALLAISFSADKRPNFSTAISLNQPTEAIALQISAALTQFEQIAKTYA